MRAGTKVIIRSVPPSDAGFVSLVSELDAFQASIYPPESNFFDSPDELARADASIFIAMIDDAYVGCGAVKRFAGYAEIKRMYVIDAYRQRGIGKKILDHLEAEARNAGINAVRLETGIRQPAALALYERNGYQRRGAFGDYREDDPLLIFLEKQLDSG